MEEDYKYFVMMTNVAGDELLLHCGTMKWAGDDISVRRIRMFLYGHSSCGYVAEQYAGVLEAIMGTINLAADMVLDDEGTSLRDFGELETRMIASPLWGLMR